VKAGETFAMADIQGPGVIRHIWLTFAESSPNWLAKDGAAAPDEVVLRMYWDGASEPAVEAPLGDFFTAGFGKRAEVESGPVVVQGGDSYNCFWAMPFFKSARITVTNESSKPLAALYFQVDYTKEKELPAGTAYFCAQVPAGVSDGAGEGLPDRGHRGARALRGDGDVGAVAESAVVWGRG
jgi:hypothetical protein